MHKHPHHNNYLTELENVLAQIKAQLIEDEAAKHVLWQSAEITEDSSSKDKSQKQSYFNRAAAHLKSLTHMYNTAYELQLVSEKVLSMATIGYNDEVSVSSKIATSARSIEKASEAIQALNSLAASINANTATEDSDTVVSHSATEVMEKGIQAAKAIEIASLNSLRATIFATEANAKFLLSDVTSFQSSANTMAKSIQQTKSDASTNFESSYDVLQLALQQNSDDQIALEAARLDWKSAEMVNNEDDIELGAKEARAIVRADQRKAANTPKQAAKS